MTLARGTRLGPYEIVAPLGAGGMGEVFRAHDSRLGRDVAIKALPAAFAQDPERLARFEREAKLLASLSHPNIAGIHGLEEVAGTRYLVLEFVEGETLAARIARGALPVGDAVDVCRQVAAGVEAAHEAGVVHRDLKPGNVMLRPDGTVKVLDFGLAKGGAAHGASSEAGLSMSPTMTHAATGLGVILGTAAYMSPEQARGRAVDRRTDVWSFGCVLYECVAGRLAFEGETVSDMVARILEREPDWSALPAGAPARLRALLKRCLEKDVKQRLQAIGEARIALDGLVAHPGEAPSPEGVTPIAPRARRFAGLPWLVSAVALAALAIVLARRPGPTAATELSIVPPGGRRVAEDLGYLPLAIAPDGRSVAYTVRAAGLLKLRIRRLDTREDTEIAVAEGARNLFFSRDSEWIGFFDTRKMHKVSVRGGAPVELADALQDRLGTWLDDGTIVYSRDTTEPLYRIPESGGTPVAITTLDSARRERTHRFPNALDGGPWVVFTVQTVDSPGGYDDASIDAVSVKTGERRHLYKGARRAVWAPGGHLILARGTGLYAVKVDPRDPRITRDPVPVLADVSGDGSTGASYFAIADDGTLAWIPGGEPEKMLDVGWFDRGGRWTPAPLTPGPYGQLYLSPDGWRALVTAGPGGGSTDIWLADLRSGGMNRLTHGGTGGSAAWLPDGARFAYTARDSTPGGNVVVRRLDGSGGVREIHRAAHPLIVTDVTPDGLGVVFSDYGKRGGRIHIAPVDGGARARTLEGEGGGYEQAGVVSPDGRWLAYNSNKSRREEIFVRRLGASGGSWQVSTRGGGGVRWGREGRELFYVSGEVLQRVSVTVRGEELTLGQAEPLFEVPPSPTESSFRDYDYDPATDRFLFTRPPHGVVERREIAVSLGWSRRLAKALPASGTKRP